MKITEKQRTEIDEMRKTIEDQKQRLDGLASGFQLTSNQLNRIIYAVKQELKEEASSTTNSKEN